MKDLTLYAKDFELERFYGADISRRFRPLMYKATARDYLVISQEKIETLMQLSNLTFRTPLINPKVTSEYVWLRGTMFGKFREWA